MGMVTVRTVRRHQNGHAPSFVKNPGRLYDVPEGSAARLKSGGYVERADGPKAPDAPAAQTMSDSDAD